MRNGEGGAFGLLGLQEGLGISRGAKAARRRFHLEPWNLKGPPVDSGQYPFHGHCQSARGLAQSKTWRTSLTGSF